MMFTVQNAVRTLQKLNGVQLKEINMEETPILVVWVLPLLPILILTLIMYFLALIVMNHMALQMNGCYELVLMGKTILACQVLIDGWIFVRPAIL